MRVLVLLTSVALVLVAGVQGGLRRGSLAGDVRRGPIAPVCAVEQPCDEPARHVTLLFSHEGAVVGRVESDTDGHYALRLPAGVYDVRRLRAAGIDRRLEPNRVRVYAGRLTRVDFAIDTGIR
jgi:hypothetical protein